MSAAIPADAPALSGKEAKAAAKAAKAARRAAEKDAKGIVPDVPSRSNQSHQSGSSSGTRDAEMSRPAAAGQQQQQQLRPRGQSQSQAQRPVPLKRRNSNDKAPASTKDKNEVSLFKHLYTSGPKPASIDVHPAVLALGHQMATYVVCGSSARCVAMLLAFKQVSLNTMTENQSSL